MEGRLENLLWVVDATHGRLLRRPTVGFILPLLQGMMIGLGWEERKAGEAPKNTLILWGTFRLSSMHDDPRRWG